MSSDDYADRAHKVYTEGRYDEALEILREALEIFPSAAELHVGMGYARLARDEFAWSRVSFHEALSLEPNNEDALAGMGEVMLKFGRREAAFRCFDAILALGFKEDHDLMLQVGRALLRENVVDRARDFFASAARAHPESGEAAAALGYALHRSGDDVAALKWLRRSVELEANDAEARVYLGNVLYDRGDYDAALTQYELTDPLDHIEELALWRYVELKKSLYRLETDDPELRPWIRRLHELQAAWESDDRVLVELESTRADGTYHDPNQLDFFAAQLMQLQGRRRRALHDVHVTMKNGSTYSGSWEQIVLQILRDDGEWPGGSLAEYMEHTARKSSVETGVKVPAGNAEAFIRGIAAAGLLQIST